MEKITTDILAERGFWFLGHNLMTDGTLIIDVYGRPFKSSGKIMETVADLEEALKVYEVPKKKKPVKD